MSKRVRRRIARILSRIAATTTVLTGLLLIMFDEHLPTGTYNNVAQVLHSLTLVFLISLLVTLSTGLYGSPPAPRIILMPSVIELTVPVYSAVYDELRPAVLIIHNPTMSVEDVVLLHQVPTPPIEQQAAYARAVLREWLARNPPREG